jgi:hypothetical protein
VKIKHLAHRWARLKSCALAFFLFSLISPHAFAATDWAQPPVGCVEEVIPELPNRACLDLTNVADPKKDWPAGISAQELAYWQGRKRPIEYCRGREVLRREAAAPGTFSAGIIEVSWMQVAAVDHHDAKVSAIYEASRANKIPPQVLLGALYQESMLSELGIAEDGGNYSCGVGQINIMEWCRWANDLSASRKAALGWPASGAGCGRLDPEFLKPFYSIAKSRLHGLPEYRLAKSHFVGISFDDVVDGFPSAPAGVQKQRYQLSRSFIDNCSDPASGIAAKAHELASLYKSFVPAGLKQHDFYSRGDHFQRSCAGQAYAEAYPLNAGWLLAVGTYNAGPRAVDALAYYNQWSRSDMASSRTFADFTPLDMIESFYWSGRYSPSTDKIHLTTLDSADSSWIWFKPCVLQRHIAKVIQHVTLPGAADLASSLEGAYKCAKSRFDPTTGELLKSGVPPARQRSSGVR